jgi:hypothetical protein
MVKKTSHRSCFAQALLISLNTLTEMKPTPNITNLVAQSKYVNMTQEAIKPRKQAKQNCDDSLTSSKTNLSEI